MVRESPFKVVALVALSIVVYANTACDGGGCPQGTMLNGKLCVRPRSGEDAGAQAVEASGASGPSKAGATGTLPSSQLATSAAGQSAGSSAGPGTSASAGVGADAPMTMVRGSIGSTAAGTGVSGASGGGALSQGTAGSSGARCGDGVIDRGELCDGACPVECVAPSTCVTTSLSGAAATCNAECSMQQITDCKSGDGCCAAGCTYATDQDCSKSCGDGVVSPPELCEPGSDAQPCPTTCDDQDACSKDNLIGAATECSANCTHMPVTAPANSDGCCPSGANAKTDNDCMPKCGNGVVEEGEACDPVSSCPRSCDDGELCTADTLVGSASQCSAECKHTPITAAKAGDRCCPDGANANTDSDCKPDCGNGVVEAPETCDGRDCPTTCNNGRTCMRGEVVGSAAQCNARCMYTPITEPRGGDSCCPPNANANADSDCSPRCGNSVVERNEDCDDGNTNSNDGCSYQCKKEVVNTAYGACSTNSDCSNGGVCFGGTCFVPCGADRAVNAPCDANGSDGLCLYGSYCVPKCDPATAPGCPSSRLKCTASTNPPPGVCLSN